MKVQIRIGVRARVWVKVGIRLGFGEIKCLGEAVGQEKLLRLQSLHDPVVPFG